VDVTELNRPLPEFIKRTLLLELPPVYVGSAGLLKVTGFINGIQTEILSHSDVEISIVSSEFIPESKVYSLNRKIIPNGIRLHSTQAAGILLVR